MPSFKKFYKENRKKAIQSQKNSLKLLQLLMILCSYNFNVAVRISINQLDAIRRCFEQGENIKYVSEDIGYSRASIYQWRKRYLKEGTLGLMNHKNIPPQKLDRNITQKKTGVSSSHEMEELKKQMLEMRMEIDILKETINVLKKDPGIDQTALSNREKAVIIDALKTKYSLLFLLKKLQLSKSSYYYQKKVLFQPDKYISLRIRIKELFTQNKNRYVYRRIHALLKREGIIVSEKIVRQIMKEEHLVVKVKRTAKYNSYAGEVTPSVPNKIEKDFSAKKPNSKWLNITVRRVLPQLSVFNLGNLISL